MKYILSLPQNLVSDFHQLENKKHDTWYVTSDPEGKRLGSGGGTANALTRCWEHEDDATFNKWQHNHKKIIIHAGGLSRRLPAYAPSGKILIPLPVFRWSRGQNIHQKLLNLQLPLLERIMHKAPPKLNTLITSGDVLILNQTGLPDIPEADVVCFGLWTEPDKAANHGVFFIEHGSTGNLAFMFQKPSVSTITELTKRFDQLIDIGVWLLSDRAIEILLKKCGWNSATNRYKNSVPDYYDLYSDFGQGLGATPVRTDPELNGLSTVIIALDQGEFYHFGKTNELIESAVSLQNRVLNQRVIWHRRIKPHPAIFVLNARTEIQFTGENQYLWIENSHISKNWKLGKNQMITGIPQNNWDINLPDHVCLDIIPMGNGNYCVRPYGYSDDFKGLVQDENTRWFGQSFKSWFENRNIKWYDFIPVDRDIQFTALFPVLPMDEIDGPFIQWMINIKLTDNDRILREKYLKAHKMSAAEICDFADLTELYKQRQLNCAHIIPIIAKNHEHSIFYQLDLEKLSEDYVKLDIPLPPELSADAPVMKQIHDFMFRAKVTESRNGIGKSFENKAFGLLKESIIASCFQIGKLPVLTLMKDQIIWGRSPVRIDLAGGWTDTPPYCLINGGKVLNLAINLNDQPPLQCFIKSTTTKKIIIRSIDLGVERVISSYDQLTDYYSVGSAFAITKAALSVIGFSPEFCPIKYKNLKSQLEDFGGGLEITTLAAVPKGSGLGTSSILAATVLGTLAQTCNLNWDPIKLSQMTLILEQLLTTGGGWQDQVGGITQGIKLIETKPGFEQIPVIRWLPDRMFHEIDYKSSMLLYYTGVTRVAKSILSEIVRGMFLNSGQCLDQLEEIGNLALETFEVIQRSDYIRLGQMVNKSWEFNNQLDNGTSTPEIEKTLKIIDRYLIGKKLAGAGGGGFMFMMAKDMDAAKKIKELLISNPLSPNARFVDFQLSDTGLQITKS